MMAKQKKSDYRDPRRLIGVQHVTGYDRRIMERTKFPCQKLLAKLLLTYEDKDIKAAIREMQQWDEFQLQMMAKYGVAVK